jgi:hypothetical protein
VTRSTRESGSVVPKAEINHSRLGNSSLVMKRFKLDMKNSIVVAVMATDKSLDLVLDKELLRLLSIEVTVDELNKALGPMKNGVSKFLDQGIYRNCFKFDKVWRCEYVVIAAHERHDRLEDYIVTNPRFLGIAAFGVAPVSLV